MKWLSLALLLVGCGPSQSFNVNGYSLPVRDQRFYSYPGGYFCNGLAPDQVRFILDDYSPSCPLDQQPGSTPYDETRGHTSIEIVVALSANLTYAQGTHMPFTFDAGTTCDGGGGDALATLYHYPAGPLGTNPDMTIVADSGSVRVFSYKATDVNATATGDFTLSFAGTTITGSINALNCNP
jgi:hypothetical protein